MASDRLRVLEDLDLRGVRLIHDQPLEVAMPDDHRVEAVLTLIQRRR
jgi:hypothetical protein